MGIVSRSSSMWHIVVSSSSLITASIICCCCMMMMQCTESFGYYPSTFVGRQHSTSSAMMMAITTCTPHTQQHPNQIRIRASLSCLRMKSPLDNDSDDDYSLLPTMTCSEMEQLTVVQLRQKLRLRGEKVGEKSGSH